MRLYDLYEEFDNENCAVFVISDTDYEIMYINKKAAEFAPAAEENHSFLAALCGRKEPCRGCPLYMTLDEKEYYTEPLALCAFAKVSFSKIKADDGTVIVSRWRDENADILAESGLFELGEALEALGNSRESFDSILLTYYKDGRGRLSAIRKFYDARSYKDLRIEVHGLKSASFIVGLKAFGEYSKQLEYACHAIEDAAANDHSVESDVTSSAESVRNDNTNAKTSEPITYEASGMVFSTTDPDGCITFIDYNIEKYLSDFSDILALLSTYFKDIDTGADSDTSTDPSDQSSSDAADFDKSQIPEVVRIMLLSASSALEVYDLDNAQSQLNSALNTAEDETLKTIIQHILNSIDAFDYDSASTQLANLL